MTLSLPLGIDRPAQDGDTARHALDAFYTPRRLARRLVGLLPLGYGQTVTEPSAGGGAFVQALQAHRTGPRVLAVDVNPLAPGLAMADDSWVGSFLDHREPADFFVGNPPFQVAEAHIRHALSLARVGAAFLLRLAFLETAQRFPFWQEHPASHIYVLSERPSFTGGATDSAAYAFFVWRRGHRGPAETHVISWR